MIQLEKSLLAKYLVVLNIRQDLIGHKVNDIKNNILSLITLSIVFLGVGSILPSPGFLKRKLNIDVCAGSNSVLKKKSKRNLW